jgi:putative DNA-invertase from lambdoid prophage Rac
LKRVRSSLDRAARAAIYVRVSTSEQTTRGQGRELVGMAKARGWIVVRVFEEVESARKARPIFDQMMAEAHRAAFDVVLVWALDRFGRSTVSNLEAVATLDAAGVRLVSAREPWLDTTGPHRSLLIMIFSWVAEQELARLVERTRAGLARTVAEGTTLGRPRANLHLETVRAMLSQEGATQKTVARALKVSTRTLRRHLAPELPE